MIIQFNTDNNVSGNDKHSAPLVALINDELNRFSDQITRVEVHLSDVNGDKVGQDDKQCMLEARLGGLKPIAVTHNANSHEEAVGGALEKMKTSLDRVLGKLRKH